MGGLQMLLFVAVLAFTVLPAHAAWGSSQSIIDAPPSPTPAEWADDINATASVVDTLVRGRLKHIYARTKTDACRHQIATKLTDYLTSEIEEHGPWMKTLSKQVTHNFKNQCPKEKPSGGLPNGSKKPEEMRMFYLVMAHKSPPQVARLIRALQHKNHHFAIHFDGKSSPDLISQMKATIATPEFSNVELMTERYNVSWGGFGMIQVASAGMRLALRRLDEEAKSGDKTKGWDFFMDISESHYPLHSVDYMMKAFAQFSPEANFMGMGKMTVHANEWFMYTECDHVVHRVGKLQVPHGIELQVGQQWVTLSPPFVRYIMQNGTDLVQPLWNYMSHMRIPDESFFQTILLHSPYCHTLMKVDHCFVNWDKNEPGGRKCLMANPNFCGRSPTRLRMSDLPLLQASNNFFARKVDPDHAESVALMDALDKMREVEAKEKKDPPKAGGTDQFGKPTKWHGSKDDEYVMTDVSFVQRVPNVWGAEGATEMCLTVTGSGFDRRSVTVEPCAKGKRQRFMVGPCWGDLDNKKIKINPKNNCVGRDDGNDGADTSIQLPPLGKNGVGNRRCSIKPVGQHVHCLDYAGQITGEGNPALIWNCQRSWNQLFVFRPGTCHLMLEPPQEHDGAGGHEKSLCFASFEQSATDATKHWPASTIGRICKKENKHMQWEVHQNFVPGRREL